MDLTIIIPTYNRNSSVAECVLALDHNEADIIVVDDASDKPVVVPATGARVIRHDRHRGRCAALNTGLKAAAHDLVLIIDDDIYAAPDMVIRMVDEAALQNNPKLGIAARVVWDPDVALSLTMRWLDIPGTISCFGKSFEVIAALIAASGFYIGPDSGISWIATTTETPMGAFMDPLRKNRLNVGFRDVLRGEKNDIEEWDVYTSPRTVIEHVKSTVAAYAPVR